MDTIDVSQEERLLAEATTYFTRALPKGEYAGWVMHRRGETSDVVAGAGVQIRSMLPRPHADGTGLLIGLEGIVMNMYVEHAWRRRGLARRIMDAIIEWAPSAGIVRLVLHASDEGRPLYESMGFVATNEMRFTGRLESSR